MKTRSKVKHILEVNSKQPLQKLGITKESTVNTTRKVKHNILEVNSKQPLQKLGITKENIMKTQSKVKQIIEINSKKPLPKLDPSTKSTPKTAHVLSESPKIVTSTLETNPTKTQETQRQLGLCNKSILKTADVLPESPKITATSGIIPTTEQSELDTELLSPALTTMKNSQRKCYVCNESNAQFDIETTRLPKSKVLLRQALIQIQKSCTVSGYPRTPNVCKICLNRFDNLVTGKNNQEEILSSLTADFKNTCKFYGLLVENSRKRDDCQTKFVGIKKSNKCLISSRSKENNNCPTGPEQINEINKSLTIPDKVNEIKKCSSIPEKINEVKTSLTQTEFHKTNKSNEIVTELNKTRERRKWPTERDRIRERKILLAEQIKKVSPEEREKLLAEQRMLTRKQTKRRRRNSPGELYTTNERCPTPVVITKVGSWYQINPEFLTKDHPTKSQVKPAAAATTRTPTTIKGKDRDKGLTPISRTKQSINKELDRVNDKKQLSTATASDEINEIISDDESISNDGGILNDESLSNDEGILNDESITIENQTESDRKKQSETFQPQPKRKKLNQITDSNAGCFTIPNGIKESDNGTNKNNELVTEFFKIRVKRKWATECDKIRGRKKLPAELDTTNESNKCLSPVVITMVGSTYQHPKFPAKDHHTQFQVEAVAITTPTTNKPEENIIKNLDKVNGKKQWFTDSAADKINENLSDDETISNVEDISNESISNDEGIFNESQTESDRNKQSKTFQPQSIKTELDQIKGSGKCNIPDETKENDKCLTDTTKGSKTYQTRPEKANESNNFQIELDKNKEHALNKNKENINSPTESYSNEDYNNYQTDTDNFALDHAYFQLACDAKKPKRNKCDNNENNKPVEEIDDKEKENEIKGHEQEEPNSDKTYHHFGIDFFLLNKRSDVFTCDYCMKDFTNKFELELHLAIHPGEQYVCQLCGSSFSHITSYWTHKKCHEGEVPKVHIVTKRKPRKVPINTTHVTADDQMIPKVSTQDKEIETYEYDFIPQILVDKSGTITYEEVPMPKLSQNVVPNASAQNKDNSEKGEFVTQKCADEIDFIRQICVDETGAITYEEIPNQKRLQKVLPYVSTQDTDIENSEFTSQICVDKSGTITNKEISKFSVKESEHKKCDSIPQKCVGKPRAIIYEDITNQNKEIETKEYAYVPQIFVDKSGTITYEEIPNVPINESKNKHVFIPQVYVDKTGAITYEEIPIVYEKK